MSAIEFPKKSIFMCNGSKCGKHYEIKKYLKKALKENELNKSVEIFKMDCSDRCKHAPILYSQPEDKWYHDVDIKKAEKIITKII